MPARAKKTLTLILAAFVCGLLLGALLFTKDVRERTDRARPEARDGSGDPTRPACSWDGEGSDREAEREGDGGAEGGEGARGRAPAAVRRNLREQIRRNYRERKKEEMPADLLEAAVRTVDAELEEDLARRLAAIASEHENRRGIYGEMRDPPNILLQARDDIATLLPRKSRLVDAPLDLAAQVRDRQIHVQGGGAIPPWKVLVIEGVELEARLGDDRRGGGVWVYLGHTQPVAQPNLRTTLRMRLKGRAIVRPGLEGRVSLATQTGVASLRLDARLVSVEEAAKLEAEPFRWLLEGSEGLVSNRPVVMQVMADHGGGNPRRAHLDGSDNGRFDARMPAPFFDGNTKVDSLSRSLVYYEGEGLIPPGKAYVVTRVEYRGHLSVRRGSRSDFVLRVGRETIVKTHAKETSNPAGVWEGRIVIPAGKEKTVSLTLSYFGVGEARLFGELVDASR